VTSRRMPTIDASARWTPRRAPQVTLSEEFCRGATLDGGRVPETEELNSHGATPRCRRSGRAKTPSDAQLAQGAWQDG
jgi:hypothetical protein